MDPGRFYGHNRHTNIFPENGLSDDDLASDSDTEIPTSPSAVPFRRPVTIPETDDEFSDEDDIPLSHLPSTSKAKKNRLRKDPTVTMKWSTEHLPPYNMDNFMFTGETELPEDIQELDSPADFFLYLFTDELITMKN